MKGAERAAACVAACGAACGVVCGAVCGAVCGVAWAVLLGWIGSAAASSAWEIGRCHFHGESAEPEAGSAAASFGQVRLAGLSSVAAAGGCEGAPAARTVRGLGVRATDDDGGGAANPSPARQPGRSHCVSRVACEGKRQTTCVGSYLKATLKQEQVLLLSARPAQFGGQSRPPPSFLSGLRLFAEMRCAKNTTSHCEGTNVESRGGL
eukprot:2514911-Pleurochrysis_carterae.AAC.2